MLMIVMAFRLVAEGLIKTTRLTVCPECDNEFRVGLDVEDCHCGDCGEDFQIEPEGSYSEEFVWHPSRKF